MSAEKIKPLFLGPKAENQDLYESIIVEAIRDNCFLRKNFHPEDKNIISEKDKLSHEFQKTKAEFTQKMQEILAELKKGVPIYHPRYIGHMYGDLLLPAIAAYFSTMLYNPNNVVGEVSTATTTMELDYIRNLCRMVGYNGFKDLVPENKKNVFGEQSWGHLCSGGTSANIEALWVARNMKYYPLSVKLAIDNLNELAINNPNGEKTESDVEKFLKSFGKESPIKVFGKDYNKINNIDYKLLFNLSVADVLHLKDFLYRKVKEKADKEYDEKSSNFKEKKDKETYISDIVKGVKKNVDKYSVVELGVYGIHSLVEKQINKDKQDWKYFPMPKLYIAKSNHYSWGKAMDIIGIGKSNLVEIKMTDEFSMDFEEFKNEFNKDCPTLAVVGILGSSKQGSIDPLDKIVEFRNELETKKEPEKNKSFYFHIDAAFGGYFPSLLWKETEEKVDQNFGKKYEPIEKEEFISFLSNVEYKNYPNFAEKLINQNAEKLFNKLKAAREADSYTIDPHKMGYVPYPAGSILYKDTRLKDFISYLPSYLNKPEENSERRAFLGQWTLEGSRPGAVAAACYMSNQVLPFNQSGYGLLARNTVQMANLFMDLIRKFNNDGKINRGYEIFPIYVHPETNIVEYILVNKSKIKKLKYLNILTKKLYGHFSVSDDAVIPSKTFMVAKEDFEQKDIPPEVWKRLKDEEIEEEGQLVILSSVFMNPLSIYIENVEEYYETFFREMVEYADGFAMPEILFEQILEENEDKRLKVLWVENEAEVKKTKRELLYKSNIGQYLDIDFLEYRPDEFTDNKLAEEVQNKNYEIIILDLNLLDNSHNDVTEENTETALDLYRAIGDKQKKVIFCSQFFKKRKEEIKKKLKDEIQFEDAERMIAKPENEKDLNPLINSIFKVFNR